MKWTEYPDRKAWKDRRDGVKREGAIWSDAPPPGAKWVLPSDRPPRAREFVLVRPLRGDGAPGWYSVIGEKE